MAQDNGVNNDELSLDEIREYRRLAKQYPNNRASKIITRLLDDRNRVREELITARLKLVAKWDEYDENTPIPFGKYKGERLADVPNDYLQWWWSKNSDRKIILLEMDYGPWAQRAAAIKKLRLHDFLKGNGYADIQ